MTDDEISNIALTFAKKNKNKIRIAREHTDPVKYAPDSEPISVFMAGSPGAGKTEVSQNLIKHLERGERRVIRIDSDELREIFIPYGYNGSNSKLFQPAVSVLVEKIHDLALHNRQSFILDGTFSNYEKALKNIQRSLDEKRAVTIIYVYQRPDIAWQVTQAREQVEGRNIPKDVFVREFFDAKETVGKVAEEFGKQVTVLLVKQDSKEKKIEKVIEILESDKQIDEEIKEHYTKDGLEKLL